MVADTKSVMYKTLFYVGVIMLAYVWYLWETYKKKK